MTCSRGFVFFLAVAFVAAISLPVQAVLIDDFTDASGIFVDPGPAAAFALTADAAPFGSIIGGVRESGAHNLSGGGGVDVSTKLGTGLGGTPVMSYSSETGVVGAMELKYDAGGPGLGGGLGEDFTLGGDNAFNIGVNFADFPVDLFIGVVDADGDAGTSGPFPMPGLLPGGAPVGVPVLYSSFAAAVDFDKLTSVSFFFDAPVAATDLEVLFLESTFVVPEPATFALALFGFCGVLAARRRVA